MENITVDKVIELQKDGKKILVDFWAKWCMPCKQLIPRLENLESQYPNVVFVKVDIDENMDHVLNLGITSVPTVMVYDGENLIKRMTGAQQESVYKEILNNL